MSTNALGEIVTVITMIVVLAIIAVLVSKNAATGDVLSAGGGALANAIKAAVAPVSANAGTATELNHTGAIDPNTINQSLLNVG